MRGGGGRPGEPEGVGGGTVTLSERGTFRVSFTEKITFPISVTSIVFNNERKL